MDLHPATVAWTTQGSSDIVALMMSSRGKAFVLARVAAAIAAVAMLVYRCQLAYVSSRLSATGSFEQAIFVLLADPLWQMEVSISTALGLFGSADSMNAAGFLLWGLIAAGAVLFAMRGVAKMRSEP